MLTELARDNLGFLTLLLACIAERWLPLVSWYHPNTLLGGIFTALAKRVYREKESASYQKFSGTLAFLLPLLILCPLTFGIFSFAFHPDWLGALLLYLMLDSQSGERKALRIARLLKQQQKTAARELAGTLLARENARLSEAGICKATIETMTLRLARHYFAVLFWFLLTGPIGALAYRLLTLMQQGWRAVMLPDSPFLLPLKRVLWLLEWLPVRLLALTLLLGSQTRQGLHFIKYYARHYYQTNTGWLLSVLSASLGAQLGGPAYYRGVRYNRMRIGQQRQPVPEDILMARARLGQAKSLWFATLIMIKLAVVALTLGV